MKAPELWIIAGPNGAGKSTCVANEPIANLVQGVQFLNPDDRTRAKLQSLGYKGFIDAPVDVQSRLFFESADEVSTELDQAILKCHPVGVETVLSTNKYQPAVDAVRAQQGFVGLIYIALVSSLLASQRVTARVQSGGHGIPDDKIAERWRRSLDNLGWFASNSSAFWIIDNSEPILAIPRRLVASGKSGIIDYFDESAFPELKAALLSLPRR